MENEKLLPYCSDELNNILKYKQKHTDFAKLKHEYYLILKEIIQEGELYFRGENEIYFYYRKFLPHLDIIALHFKQQHDIDIVHADHEVLHSDCCSSKHYYEFTFVPKNEKNINIIQAVTIEN